MTVIVYIFSFKINPPPPPSKVKLSTLICRGGAKIHNARAQPLFCALNLFLVMFLLMLSSWSNLVPNLVRLEVE